MARRKRKATNHPNRELELAIRHAVDLGWELVRGEETINGFSWGDS
jgi:hypothetical protein